MKSCFLKCKLFAVRVQIRGIAVKTNRKLSEFSEDGKRCHSSARCLWEGLAERQARARNPREKGNLPPCEDGEIPGCVFWRNVGFSIFVPLQGEGKQTSASRSRERVILSRGEAAWGPFQPWFLTGVLLCCPFSQQSDGVPGRRAAMPALLLGVPGEISRLLTLLCLGLQSPASQMGLL